MARTQTHPIVREFFSLFELSEYSGISERTLRDLIRRPTDPLPHYRIGKLVKVRRSDFDAWAERQRHNQSLVDRIVLDVQVFSY